MTNKLNKNQIKLLLKEYNLVNYTEGQHELVFKNNTGITVYLELNYKYVSNKFNSNIELSNGFYKLMEKIDEIDLNNSTKLNSLINLIYKNTIAYLAFKNGEKVEL